MRSDGVSAQKPKLLENLQKFKFQKKEARKPVDSDNEMDSSSVLATNNCHSLSDSDPDSSCGSSSNLSNDTKARGNDEKKEIHDISDSEEVQEVPSEQESSSSDSNGKNSDTPPKVYSRIKKLNSFKFTKKKNENVSSNTKEQKSPIKETSPLKQKKSPINGKIRENNGKNEMHVISDSEEEQEVPSKQESSSSSDSSDKNSDTPPKKYSRIKKLNSFKFTKKENENVSSSTNKRKSPIKETISLKRKRSPMNGKIKKKRKKSSDSDDDNGPFKNGELVYDSDEEDSDMDISDDMTESQKRVFEFLNTASSFELLQIPSCTQNRVNAIMEGRPFEGWKHMVTKLRSGKNLGTQVLNHTLETLKTRHIVSKLMKKCLDIAITTEQCIAAGSATLTEQPKMLTEGLNLKGYQMVGLNWLAVMHGQNLSGILADEMGLGKTIQVIAFLAYLKERGMCHAPHLVVAPSTTLENWAIEFTRWCPNIRVVVYHGSPDERRSLRILWFKQKFKEFDVIITTYSMVCSSYEEKKMFKIVPMHYVIFDEAHMLKNMNTQRYFNLFGIKAERRILLTGTPLQNNLLELMSLLNFVMPGMFAKRIECIKIFFSRNSKLPVDDLPDFEREQVALAKRIMKPFVLRRLKRDVLKDLPVKTSEVIRCLLTGQQATRYEILTRELKELADNFPEEHNYLTSFMQLRKLANHPLTLRNHYKEKSLKEIAKQLARDSSYKLNNEEYVFEDLFCMSDLEIHKLSVQHDCLAGYELPDRLFLDSTKFHKLDELLPKLKSEGHRVIIFSQFVFMLDLLEEYLRIRDHSYVRLDGSTRSLDRQDLIDNYNEDASIFVFLLTTRAGGVGINLTTADTVIIHDVDFNPYNDKQAEDRCHRLGQTRPVHVIRMVTEGTVEEVIYAKAQSKLSLEQELTGMDIGEESEDNKTVELLLKEVLGLAK